MSNKLSFEEAISELEKIAEKLENADISLEESVALFEKGVMLSDECSKLLKDTEQKIISITEAEKEEKL